MDSDEVANDPSVVSVPGKRRATYTPPVRRKPPAAPAAAEVAPEPEPAAGPAAEPEPAPEPATEPAPEPAVAERTTHDDDELASALEAQVSRMTSAVPIIAGPTVVGADGLADAAALTDDQVAALVDVDLSSHDTLAAIEHLERVLVARATMAIPIQARPSRRRLEPVAVEPTAENEPAAKDEPAPEEPAPTEEPADSDDRRPRAEETWDGRDQLRRPRPATPRRRSRAHLQRGLLRLPARCL